MIEVGETALIEARFDRKRGRILAIVLACLVVIGCDDSVITEPPLPGAGVQLLSVPLVTQQTEVWCWAATIEMITSYYGRDVRQCVTLSQFLLADCCTFLQACAIPAPSMQTIQAGLFSLAGLRSFYVPSALSFDDVRAEIDAGRPIIIGYRGSFLGHVVVLYGYDEIGNLWIHDPFYGSFGPIPYGQAFSYAGNAVWSESIVGIG